MYRSGVFANCTSSSAGDPRRKSHQTFVPRTSGNLATHLHPSLHVLLLCYTSHDGVRLFIDESMPRCAAWGRD